MKLKDIKLKKLVKILIITAAISIMLLGLVVWLFNIPAYIRGEKGPYTLTPENSISVNVNKTYEIEDITSIDADLQFSDIDVVVTDGDKVSFVYSGLVSSKPEFKEPYLVFNKTMGKLQIKTTFKTGYSIGNSTVILKLSIPRNRLKELQLSTSSGDVTVFGSVASELVINTSSGKIAVDGFSGEGVSTDSSSGSHDLINLDVKYLGVSSSSGKVSIDESQSIKSIVDTSSGDVLIGQFFSSNSTIDTTSGQVNIDDYSGNLNFSSSSGTLYVSFGEEGDEIIADTSSGDVHMFFGSDSGFKIESETSSGSFDINFPLTLDGDYNKDNIHGLVGDGIGLVKINTSSGDITIKER